MFGAIHADLKECAGLLAAPPMFWRPHPSTAERPTFVDSLCLDNIIEFHHCASENRVEELGQPHFDVLKTPDAVGLRRQAPAHNVRDQK